MINPIEIKCKQMTDYICALGAKTHHIQHLVNIGAEKERFEKALLGQNAILTEIQKLKDEIILLSR